MNSFEIFVLDGGISDNVQRRALLLYCGGTEIQDVFCTLWNTGTTYEQAKVKPDFHSHTKKDVTWEPFQFGRTILVRNCSVEDYCIILKQNASHCEFDIDLDNQIRDQILDKWPDTGLKTKLHGGSKITPHT